MGEEMNTTTPAGDFPVADKAKDFDYPTFYESSITNLLKKYTSNDHILKELKFKRDLGLKKYGENSFQGSLAKSLASLSEKHFLEEIYDAINYCAHILFVRRIKSIDLDPYDDLMLDLLDIIAILDSSKPSSDICNEF